MFGKPKEFINEKIVKPVKDATSLAITAIFLAVMAIIIAVVR